MERETIRAIVTLEAAISVPQEHAQEAITLLSKDLTLFPEIIPSAGIDGGGALSSIVITLGKAAIGYVAGVLNVLAAGHDITLQVGHTKLTVRHLRGGDLPALLDQILAIELKRLQADHKGAVHDDNKSA